MGVIITVAGLVMWWLGTIALGNAGTVISVLSLPKRTPVQKVDRTQGINDKIKIINTGIYVKVRHPVYLGISGMLVGWNLLFPSTVLLAASGCMIAILALRGGIEEKILFKRFGKEYETYRKKTWL